MKEQLERLLSLARSAWRFRWSALLVAACAGLGGAAAILALPGKYESHAQIFVDTKSVLRPLLQGLAVTEQGRDESDVVKRALLARPTLDQVARGTGLYKRTRSPEEAERLLNDLALEISVRADSSTGLYTISYADHSAKMAQAVVRALLDTFVNSSIGGRRSDTENAESFLAAQVADYERRLSDSEERLANFKKKNIGLMPDQRGDYFARLQGELATRSKLQTDLAVAEQQRDELRRKIAGDSRADLVGRPPPTDREIHAAEALDARIRDAQGTVDSLLDKYTERHPQVIAAQETLRRLQEQRQAELGGVRHTNATRTELSPVAVDPVVQNLQIALNSADVQLASLQTQLHQSDVRVAELQRMVTTGPEVEAELSRLNRDYGVTKAQYEALLQRLESARISNSADRSEELRFKVLEPPREPLRPAQPRRLLLVLGALAGALALGGAVAVLRAQLHPVLYSKSGLAAATGLPVLGTVTLSRSDRELLDRRRDILYYASALAAMVTVLVMAAVFNYPASRMVRGMLGLGDG